MTKQLTATYGRGWSSQNLFYMKRFYQCYPRLIDPGDILHAVRGESSYDEKSTEQIELFATDSGGGA